MKSMMPEEIEVVRFHVDAVGESGKYHLTEESMKRVLREMAAAGDDAWCVFDEDLHEIVIMTLQR